VSRNPKRASRTPAVTAPRTLRELMTRALAMETEASQRYAELADAMETHNNREVAALFRKLSEIEKKHAAQIVEEMGGKPPVIAPDDKGWGGPEAPETTPSDEVHYLMQPYHALKLALANEEREHVALVRAWLRKTRKPERGWAEDPDPARYTD
jgi:rubrerythrin